MPDHILRLYADDLPPGGTTDELPAGTRAIYVSGGTATLRGGGVAAALASNTAWCGPAPVRLKAGPEGARLLRWELSAGPELPLAGAGVRSAMRLAGTPIVEPGEAYLLRCDRVDFPPGGVALLHTHQGSGTRCLGSGRIRIETGGHAFDVEPGGAWFENGPDPVFARTWDDGPSPFVRGMILPRRLLGQSSIGYVNPADRDKPKNQRYQVFLDEPIDLTP